MTAELKEEPLLWEGLKICAVRVSDEYIRGDIPLHGHAADSMELHAVLAGRGWVRTPAGRRAVGAGDYFVTVGGAAHEQGSDAGDPVRELCVYASFARIGKTGACADELIGKGITFRKADEDFLAAAAALAKEIALRRSGFEDAALACFRLLLVCLARAGAGGTDSRAKNTGGAGGIFLKIDEAFLYDYRTLTLAELARRTGLSARQMQRILHAHYGASFTDLRTRARMQAADRLLSLGTLSVTRIAEETGYSCAAHFCIEYKKYNGITAGEYRRQCRADRKTTS